MVREITNVYQLTIFLVVLCFSFGCPLLLSGCAHHLQMDPRTAADTLAFQANFEKLWIDTPEFSFLTYQKINDTLADLHIYIEGDGRSYLPGNRVSDDPTPHQPLALKLALLDPHANVVYLARPCQYLPIGQNAACVPTVWTNLRFSEKIIHAMDQAVTQIKQGRKTRQLKSKPLHLIGFSGGACIAVLIAARRTDVASIRTVAGDLDHQRMTEYHHTLPLDAACLNPKDSVSALCHLPQHHFTGAKDTVVPPFISEEFVLATQKINPRCVRRTVLKAATHHEGWEEAWPNLLQAPIDCNK